MYLMGFHIPSNLEKMPSFEDLDDIAKITFGAVRFNKGINYISNINPSIKHKDKAIRLATNNFNSPLGLDLYLFFTKSNIELGPEGLSLMNQCITNEIPYLKIRKHHGNNYYEIFDWQLVDTKNRLKDKLFKEGRQ